MAEIIGEALCRPCGPRWRRSELAQSNGFSRKATEVAAEPELELQPEPEVVETAPAEAPKKRGGAKKAV